MTACLKLSNRFGAHRRRVYPAFVFALFFCIAGPRTACAQTAPQVLTLTATDADGVNTGSAPLGAAVALTTTLTAGPYGDRAWSLQGAGTLTVGAGTNHAKATYTPPSTLPANSQGTITVSLRSEPSVSVSYSFVIVNPAPALLSATPSQAVAGATIPITLTGSGFVNGAVVLVNGVAAPTTYQSATSLIAQIGVAAGSPAALSLQVRNPSPAAGTSGTLQITTANIQLTATDSDGVNTATARLGVPVSLAATETSTSYQVVGWTLQGAGSLNLGVSPYQNATYTPPQLMPANPTVTIGADMASYPVLATAYQLTLINPVPVVTSASPSQLMPGVTQTVTLTGSGFVPGTTVAWNGTSLPVTYLDYNDATVQLPVSANASGTLALQAQNPAPGGGVGASFTETVSPAVITLTATDADGVNTGTAELGTQVMMSATVSGSQQTAVSWRISDTSAGSITADGVYTAPSTLPSNTRVSIYATLVANPKVTAVYVLHVTNPVPAISAATPSFVPAGATTSVTLTGSGFVPSTVVQANSAPVPTTYLSPTSLLVQLAVNSGATGELSLEAYTASHGGGYSEALPLAIAAPVSATAAARLLDQTTFGPTTSLIQHVQQEGTTAWLAEQFNTPQTTLPIIPDNFPSYCGDAEMCLESEWWNAVLTGNDQLRQRVAFALSELFVVSSNSIVGQGIDGYANMLAADAFTNWYTIMQDVTLSPAMGIYLNMVGSYRPMGGIIANENYARENMQLFNLGLNLLNQDGTPQLDSAGNPIPVYTEAQVQAFARAYTGWTYANPDGSTPSQFIGVPNYYHPMVAVEQWHDQDPKTLLNGTTLPSGQTAEQDLAGALTNIFEHPNTPPFVCRQLIQHLVTSNPSPAYVSRVAAVFADNGNGVRGDMKSVLTAILTDPEARAGDTAPLPSGGHLREPILWLTAAMRGLGYVNIDHNDFYQYLSNYTGDLSEWPYASPSVFNFFSPGYVIPGTTLNAPEFGLENTASVTDRLTLADELMNNDITGFNADLSATSPLGKIAAIQGPAALVNALSALFLDGAMDPATAAAITSEVATVTDPAQRLRLGAYLTLTSSEYKVMH
jgi:uncharacterized protein (DUF1800 family)